MAKQLNWDGTEVGAKASNVTYNNTTSGMEATNVQSAIDELKRTAGSGGGGGSYAPYNGKRMAVIGDSFTANGVWIAAMAQKLHLLETKNRAISGGSWTQRAATQDNTGLPYLSAFFRMQLLYADYQAAGTSPDYILIVDGVNDYGNALTLGSVSLDTIDDVNNTDITSVAFEKSNTKAFEDSELVDEITETFDLTTFTGGAQATLAYITARYPNAIVKIGFTPAWQQGCYNGVNNNGWSSVDTYLDRLKTLATMYGAQFIDTSHVGICSWVASSKDANWKGANDGHPSSAANARIGAAMARLLLCNL